VVFQVRLGTVLEKVGRVQHIMLYLAKVLQLDTRQVMRAVELSKCDLMTGMVGEFPELQGLMGYYYALHDGEDKNVALALQEQYLPRFAADTLPKTSLGMALSLADRLDTLVGIFAIDGKPAGDKDPFKLRRHALAVVRLLVDCPVPLQLSDLLSQAQTAYGSKLKFDAQVMSQLVPFIFERLLSYYQTQGIGSDLVLAVKAIQSNGLHDFDQRIKALAEFIALPQASALSAACKRVNNLLQHDPSPQYPPVEEVLLQEEAEIKLFTRLISMEKVLSSLYNKGDYTSVLRQLAGLREVVDAFFEQVMVMVDDTRLKSNRLALLSRLQALLQGAADISLLQMV
jgi:glycyl-tRNA synthetase beta chain